MLSSNATDMPISMLISHMENEKKNLIEQMEVQNSLVVDLSNMIRGDRNITFMSDDTTEEQRRLADANTLEEQAIVLNIIGAMQEKVNQMEGQRDNLFKTISKYQGKMQELELQVQAQELKILALEHLVLESEDDKTGSTHSSSTASIRKAPEILRI